MRKILVMLTIALVGFSFSGKAQKNGKITGKVIDGNTRTIESASIALMKLADSSTVKMSVADKTGKFEFESIKEGKYVIMVSAVGHQKAFSEIFEINSTNNSIALKTIELVPVTVDLKGVTVTAKKPFIEQKIDRMIVNVEASVTNLGSTALDVLEKSPGISVDKDGNISLKGKDGVLVLIDGRETRLGGADLANYLRSINASQLDQVEIMTNIGK